MHIPLFEIGDSWLPVYKSSHIWLSSLQYDAKHEQRQVWYSHRCVVEPVFVPKQGCDSWMREKMIDSSLCSCSYVPEIHCTEFAILNALRTLTVVLSPGSSSSITSISNAFHETFSPEVFRDSCHLPS